MTTKNVYPLLLLACGLMAQPAQGQDSVPIPSPTYTVGTPTRSTIPLTNGDPFSGGADRRRFYVSRSNLSNLVVVDAVTGQSTGVEGGIWTFVLFENLETVTIGSGEPESNWVLENGIRFFVRAVDFSASSGWKSDLSADLGGRTLGAFLRQKSGTLTPVAQTYTATFSGGTLYYLSRAGAKDSNVTKQDIRAGARPVGTNKGSVAENANLKEVRLSGLSPGTQYTLYAIVEASDSQQSGIVTATFTTLVAAPTLARKEDAPTQSGRIYTATFTDGTLWYLLREGTASESVTQANIKAGLDAVGTNKGSLAATGDISLSGLSYGAIYTLYTMAEVSSSGQTSEIVMGTFVALPPATGSSGDENDDGDGDDDTTLREKIAALEAWKSEMQTKVTALESQNINAITFTKRDLTEPGIVSGTTKKSIVIVPNPVQQTLGLTVYQDYDYAIYDSAGGSVKTGKTSEGSIDVSELRAGTYVLQLKSVTETYALQFIKE